MAFIEEAHTCLSYGDGYLQGEGMTGQVVRISGNELFTVNTDPTVRSFGILKRDYTSGTMPGIFCNGGVLRTDAFEGNPNPGDLLKVSGSGYPTAGVATGEHAIGQAIAVDGGILKFRLLL